MKEITNSKRGLLSCLAPLALAIIGCSDTEKIIVSDTTTYEYRVTAQTSGTSNDLRDVFFVDSKKGWAVGNSGVILYTADGGANWTVQNSNTGHT
ncbi:MAG: YCF48-related protein, partial [Candidatus Zixiibacteriota bacterium]